jgi:hypothetical protein
LPFQLHWLLYASRVLNYIKENHTFCPHTAFICLKWSHSKKCLSNSISRLVFAIDGTCCEQYRLLGCNTPCGLKFNDVSEGTYYAHFACFAYFSILKTEVICCSEPSVSFDQTTRRNISKIHVVLFILTTTRTSNLTRFECFLWNMNWILYVILIFQAAAARFSCSPPELNSQKSEPLFWRRQNCFSKFLQLSIAGK